MKTIIRYIFILLFLAASGKSFAQFFNCSITLVQTADTACFPFPILADPVEDTTIPIVLRKWTLSTCSGTVIYTSPNGLNPNFGYIPPSPGCYCLKLFSVNQNGETCTSQICNIVESDTAIINATITPVSICVGGTVTATLQDLPSCGTIDTTYIFWGCGAPSVIAGNPSSVTHTYGNNCLPGKYTVSILVKNSCGCFSSKTYSQAVTIVPSPVASFSANPTTAFCVNSLTSNFTANQQAAGVTYCWYVNGVQEFCSSTSNLFSYTFPASPTCYDIKLVVSQASGCADSVTQVGYICVYSQVLPTFTVSADSVCLEPGTKTYFCANTMLVQGATASWTVTGPGGYNKTLPGSSFCDSLGTDGFYNVSLTVTDGPGCVGTVTKNNVFLIKQSTVPCFTLSSTFSCQPVFCVNATNCTNPAAASYNWISPQGTPPTYSGVTPPKICYNGFGSYTVTLQGIAGNGCSSVASQVINADTLTPTFTSNRLQGCSPLTVKFKSTTDTIGFGDKIANYTWSFPKSSPPIASQSGPALSSITQVFTTSGCYNVELTITTATGCTSSTLLNHLICVGTKPTPCIMIDTPSVKCYDSLPVVFILECDSFNQGVIMFGDGTSQTIGSSAFNAKVMAVDTIRYVYGDCGTFNVKAVVMRDSCASDTLLATIKINCPKPEFHDSISCKTGDSVYLENTSHGATRYSWSFSCSNVTSTDTNPVLTLPHCVACTAELVAYNDSLGCSYHYSLPFTTSCNGPPSFTPASPMGCANSYQPTFVNTTPGASGGTTLWDFDLPNICPITGGVGCYGGTSFTPVFNFSPGNIDMAMVYYAPGGCVDTLFGTIHSCKLTADFTPIANCLPDSFYFSATATDLYCDGKFKWNWTFPPGIGGPTNIQNPVILFPAAGTYPITLTVSDSTGCAVTVTKNINVGTAVFDKWNFDTLVCPNTQVCITNATTSAAQLNETWYFPGNPVDSFVGHSPPCITYDSEAVYPIIYHVVAGTCDKTDTQYVDVHYPVPRGFANQYFFSCPTDQGEGVIFTDSSLYYNKVTDTAEWTFYDTVRHVVFAQTLEFEPTQFFPAGVYITSLCITTNTGCKVCANLDTITVNGPYGTVLPLAPYACSCKDSVQFIVKSTNTYKIIFIYGCNQGFSIDSPVVLGTSVNPTISDFNITYCVLDTCYPQIQIYDTAGCQYTLLSAPVNIDSPSVNFAYTNFKVCDSGTIAFFDSTTYHFPKDTSYTLAWLWDFGDSLNATDTSTAVNPSYYYSHPGTYQVKLTIRSNYGCVDSIIKTIIVYPAPKAAFALSDTSLCSNNQVCITDLSTAPVPITSWVWNYGDASTTTDSTPPCHEYSAPYSPTYDVSVLVADSNGCVDSSTILLKLNLGPIANFNWQITCENMPMPFINTSTAGNSPIDSCLYTFWVGAPTPKLDPNCNTTFTFAAGFFPVQFIVGDANDCFDTIIKTVESDPLTKLSVQPGDTTICIGNSVDYSLNGVYNTISWSPNIWLSYTDSQHVVITPTGDVDYRVVAQSGVCPPASDSFTIIVVQTVPIGASASPPTIVTGLTTQLSIDSLPRDGNVIDIDSIVWSPDSSLSCVGCLNPTASPTHTTTYTVTVYYGRNGYSCSRSEQVTVDVLSTCDSGSIFVPNTFTPNGDGVNDVFTIRGFGATKIDYFRVFNRWGELLFEIQNGVMNDEQFGWNGTDRNGGKLNDGVYVYTYELECINKDKVVGKGNITLLR